MLVGAFGMRLNAAEQRLVEAGKFKEPFSYEQLIQDRFVPTMERSIIDQLVPARDEGVMIHGQKLFEDRFDYAVGVFNGVPDLGLAAYFPLSNAAPIGFVSRFWDRRLRRNGSRIKKEL